VTANVTMMPLLQVAGRFVAFVHGSWLDAAAQL
jgi:hypothetical protein